MYDSHVGRNELFIATATIGAHASATDDAGFRQRDVRFLIELFSNWVETALTESMLDVNNNQIKRYLEGLTSEGLSRQLKRNGLPVYRLTRTGLIELLSRCVHRTYVAQREQFFFLYYFVSSYKPRLEQLVVREGRQFPASLKIELEALLDVDELLKREIQEAEKELRKIEVRVKEARESSAMVLRELKKGASLKDVATSVQIKYPYELNSQKPLLELLDSVPEAYREWELTSGNLKRLRYIWEPSHMLLKAYLDRLYGLKEVKE